MKVRGGFCRCDGVAGKQPAPLPEILAGLCDPEANKRISTAQVVVEERERSADGEAVQPERHLGQFNGERVFVHAIYAALEHHAPDDGLVSEERLVHDPARLIRSFHDVVPDRRDPFNERRCVLLVQPPRYRRYILDQVGDVVGQEVDSADEEVATAHRRVEYFQVEDRFCRVE